MADQTNIEWCDSTFNPFIGCTKVSPGCDNCYAENLMDHRMHKVQWGPYGTRVRTSAANWRKPLAWDAAHAEFFAQNGRRQRVFCASLADVFDNQVEPQWRVDLFRLIEATPNLDWLLLTKRIGNWREQVLEALKLAAANSSPDLAYWIGQWFDGRPPANVWIGATVVNQPEADRDIPKLLAVSAARRFLSMEPLLGPVDLSRIDIDGHREVYPLANTTDCEDDNGNRLPDLPALDWVIVGGESGPQARPMSIQWARELRDQCATYGVPFLFKQWGEWAPAGAKPGGESGRFAFGDYEHERTRFVQTDSYPRAFDRFGARCVLERVGKKAAGRQLDGVQHDGFPKGGV